MTEKTLSFIFSSFTLTRRDLSRPSGAALPMEMQCERARRHISGGSFLSDQGVCGCVCVDVCRGGRWELERRSYGLSLVGKSQKIHLELLKIPTRSAMGYASASVGSVSRGINLIRASLSTLIGSPSEVRGLIGSFCPHFPQHFVDARTLPG